MHQIDTAHSLFTATLTAHQDAEKRLLMVTLAVNDQTTSLQNDPKIETVVVIDRSGSMSGRPLEVATSAVARLIRSLEAKDRIGVVAYDDRVDVVSTLAPPSEGLARSVESIRSGGSTALYDGWLAGARLVGPGGRVILLSDGHANVGRYCDARNLSHHAGISYTRYRVTTTTIGIGDGYDEALMAGMARQGGGNHYFAHTVEAVLDAFSNERFTLGSVVMQQVSIRLGSKTVQLGHLLAGERKSVVLEISGLGTEPPTIRFTDPTNGQTSTLPLRLPESFGHSDEVTLEWLLEKVAEAEDGVAAVHDPRSAAEARERVRSVLLKLLAHPKSEDEAVQMVVSRLEGRIQTLEELERAYDESTAVFERKRSMQSSHNMRNRYKAYSSLEEDAVEVRMWHARSASSGPIILQIDVQALALAPKERWQAWLAIPIHDDGTVLTIAMANPKDGFIQKEIMVATGRKVSPVGIPYDQAEILQLLQS